MQDSHNFYVTSIGLILKHGNLEMMLIGIYLAYIYLFH